MANQIVDVQKVVGSLPTTLSKNTFYAVRVGKGYDLYLSDSTGKIVHKLNDGQVWTIKDVIVDLNDITEVGKYHLKTKNNSNSPIKDEIYLSVDVVDGVVIQTVWSLSNIEIIHNRIKKDNSWTSWKNNDYSSKINDLKLYVQSRGTGLITNGYGLLRNNENFSSFTFDPTESKVGLGCFVCNTVNADFSNDELIPINPLQSYKVDFFIKYGVGSQQGGTYFYIAPYDADGLAITPSYFVGETFKIERFVEGEKTITIHADDRQRFSNKLSATNPIAFISPDNYVAKSGYVYPKNTYSRDYISIARTYNQTQYNRNTGVLRDTYCHKTLKSGTSVGISSTGETYAYIMPNLSSNEKITENWQYYTATFKASELNPRFANASFIKIGWLMNRNVSSGTTKISGIQLTTTNV